MEICLELNQRFGRGFQVHIIHGPLNKLFDAEPWTLPEAGYYAGVLLEAVNKELGTSYQPRDVIRVPPDALEANKKTDLAAARMLQDRPDVREAVVDGEKQTVISARCVILLIWAAWKGDDMPKAKAAMRRYCEYISTHGYRGGASKAMAELEAMDRERGIAWIKQTFSRYVQDDIAMVSYVWPKMCVLTKGMPIMRKTELPMFAVESVSLELGRLYSLCNMFALIRDSGSMLHADDVSNAICVIRDCLDTQIKALDGIDWKQ